MPAPIETIEAVATTCDWYNVPCVAQATTTWLVGALAAIPKAIFAAIIGAAAAIIEALPVPDFVTGAAAKLSTASAVQGFGYFANVVALGEGLSTLAAALGLRFLIRRLPFIG